MRRSRHCRRSFGVCRNPSDDGTGGPSVMETLLRSERNKTVHQLGPRDVVL